MDDYPSLDKLIPQDPNLPSISYQAHEHTPICIPWTSRSVVLGTGFDSSVASKAKSDTEAFRPSPLICTPGEVTYQLDPAENRNSIRQASSAHAATSYEHMDFKGTLSAGGAVLGVSGRGEFAKTVYGNTDSRKVSLQASLRIGRITSVDSLRIASDALSLLRTSPDSFHQKFGDYYLEALCLGADTSTFLSTSSAIDLKAEMRDIQVKARFLGMSKTVYADHKESAYAGSACDVTFCGFDTLSGYQRTVHATDRQTYAEIQAEAARNVASGMNLDKRAKELLRTLGLGEDVGDAIELTESQCKAVCKSGLVVELLFLPYAGLRDYVLATSTLFV